jgi:hypothetical protein
MGVVARSIAKASSAFSTTSCSESSPPQPAKGKAH